MTMFFTAKFSDVEVNVQNIEGKPVLIEHLRSERALKPVKHNAPGFLRPNLPHDTNRSYYSFEYTKLQPFHPEIPRTREALLKLLSVSISLVESIKVLHWDKLSAGILSQGRFCLDQDGNLVILGNTLLTDSLPTYGFSHYTPEDFYYLAPECYDSIQITPDYRADFYSLGVNLYLWFTGSLPIKGDDKMELMHHHLTQKPINPKDINPSIPEGLSKLILNLLAKQPGERYASAYGIVKDLEAIRRSVESGDRNPIILHLDYDPGKIDFGNTLFGREPLLNKLHEAFNKAEHFNSQLVFVEGMSGIGKTSLVQKFINDIPSKKVITLHGKFDQYKQASYGAIQMAFKDLEHQLFLKLKLDRNKLRTVLSKEIGKNAGVLKEIIPGIADLVYELGPVEVLNPIETRNRFNYTFGQFCSALRKMGISMVFFLDDWQWCDPPSLELVKSVVKNQINGLLFLFAFRGNEVQGRHPFSLFKAEAEKIPGYHHILVESLDMRLVNQMVSTALGTNVAETSELSGLIYEKTGGNPFYVKQFINSLYQRELLKYNFDDHQWQWDTRKISEEDPSRNVVDLVTQKIDKLSYEVQIILKVASFIAGRFDLDLISQISGLEKVLIRILLDVSIESGYVQREDTDNLYRYRFAHDRIQQAAYQLNLPTFKLSNQELHLAIGIYLLDKDDNPEYSGAEILLHFLSSKELIPEHRSEQIIDSIIELSEDSNLSITPEAAKQYFDLALFLSEKFEYPKHLFRCYYGLSESCFLLNEIELAEDFSNRAFAVTDILLDKVGLLRMKMLFYESYAMFEKNIETGLEALELFNIEGKNHYHENTLAPQIEKEYELFNSLTKGNLFEDLSDRKMSVPEELAIMDVLVNMNASAYFVSPYLFAWSTLKMANQTLTHGLTNSTPFAFVFMGSLLVAFYKEFNRGYTFGKVGVDLLTVVDNDQYKSRTLSIFPIFIQHFKEPILAGTKNLEESIYSGLETGDLPYAGYSFYARVRDAFLAGINLEQTLELCDDSILFMQQVNNLGLLSLMKLLKGSLLKLIGRYDSQYELVEKEALAFLLEVKFFTAVSHHYIFRSWAHCILKEFNLAAALLEQNEEIVVYAASQPHVPKHYFLDSLCQFYRYKELSEETKNKILSNQQFLRAWSESMPANFSAEYYLIEMLLKEREGNMGEALTIFNKSLKWAEVGGLLGVKAFAYEIASDMLKSDEYTVLAQGFMENAKSHFKQWNALAKIQSHQINEGQYERKDINLNMTSLVKSMQAISLEMNRADLVERLLNIIMENAGADRTVLILMDGEEPFIEAEAVSDNPGGSVIREKLNEQKNIPHNILEYVISSKKEFVLDQQNDSVRYDDQYISNNNIRSLLAMPLSRQRQLIGVLYLENHQLPGLFKGQDLEILRIIASQAAISIYNTRLFEHSSDLNIALQASRDELSKMNVLLEEKIKDRTQVLRQEIETRKQIELQLKKAQKDAEKFHQQQIKEERQESLQSKMMMLSSQMNPHFIFNSLGSVQSYILNNDTQRAVNFISEFAGLMRKNLINSTTRYISISEEIDFLDKYLLLEQIRFNNNFDYKLKENVENPHDTLIPPMLLQPFIENAVIHGLSKLKDRKGKLTVLMEEKGDKIVCTIEDNGIGRENALKYKNSGHKSVAISNLQTRLELLNNFEQAKEYTYKIVDLKSKKGPAGTRVIVSFPNDLH